MSARQFGLLVVSALAGGAAHAQDIDCQRLLKTGVPYELRLNQERVFPTMPRQTIATVRQVYRNTGNLKISYTKQSSSIMRTIGYGPFATEFILDGKRIVLRMEYAGIDIKSPPPLNTNYSFTVTAISENGEREQTTVNHVYRGAKTIALANCQVSVISSTRKAQSTKDASTSSFMEVDYSPELQEVIYSSGTSAKVPFVTIFSTIGVSVDFDPLAPK